MPGLLSLRKKMIDDKPLRGAKIVGCTSITAPTAVSYRTILFYFYTKFSNCFV